MKINYISLFRLIFYVALAVMLFMMARKVTLPINDLMSLINN